MKFLFSLLCFSLVISRGVLAGEKPHVLFIAIDDLNDYISPLDNHPGIHTPNFERLARRSVTLANAHCAAPACHPSRVAVMTGVHPTTSGIYRNLQSGPTREHSASAAASLDSNGNHRKNKPTLPSLQNPSPGLGS